MVCSISSITKCKVWWNFHRGLSQKNESLGQKRRDYILLKFFNCISISRELVVAEVCLRKELRTVVPDFVSADVFILEFFREKLEKSIFNLNHIRFSPNFIENPTVINHKPQRLNSNWFGIQKDIRYQPIQIQDHKKQLQLIFSKSSQLILKVRVVSLSKVSWFFNTRNHDRYPIHCSIYSKINVTLKLWKL